tara:strand:- start:2648 stop:2860 length:213 start_codon:yes stop_codon:yes gene_type:complete
MKELDAKQKDDLVGLVEMVTTVLQKALHLGENQGALGLAYGFLERLKKDIISGKLTIEELPKVSNKKGKK